ncbi:MAG TPA: hypothetical protein VK137_18395 [Planctomycetaceae bacterium]|nr:hypothetical protein [Planctomycetaceae bacterium]
MKLPLVCGLLSLMMTGVLGPSAIAQEKAQTDSSSEVAEYLKIARAQTELVRLQDVETGADIERVENPVYRYSEPVRGIVQGTMWVWGRKGRPAAVLELIRYDGNNDWFAFHATSDNLIKLTAKTGQTWTPKSSDLKFQPLPEAPTPADSPAGRLRQMKEFSRKFSAHEIHRGRHELRVLTTPVYRYEDRDQKLIDGALFVIAHETALEATLFLEAVQPDDAAKPIWQFAVGRSGTAEIVVLYDDKKVHHLPAVEVIPPPPTESYWRMQVHVTKETSK